MVRILLAATLLLGTLAAMPGGGAGPYEGNVVSQQLTPYDVPSVTPRSYAPNRDVWGPAGGKTAIQWVVGKDLDLALGCESSPVPPEVSHQVLGYTYDGAYYPWPTPVARINRKRGWDHPLVDTVPYSVRVEVTYEGGEEETFDVPASLQVVVNYLKLEDIPR